MRISAKRGFLIFAVAFVLQTIGTNAWALELYQWHAFSNLPSLVIAVLDGESPKDSALRYLNGIKNDPELSRLFGNAKLDASMSFSPLDNGDQSRRVLLIANDPIDYTIGEESRIAPFFKYLIAETAPPYILPVAHDVGLSMKDANEYRAKVYGHFNMAVAMGGDDVDLKPFGQSNLDSIDFNPSRDQSEAKFIRGWIEAKPGLLFGICRGAQLTSSILGYKLIPDIPKYVDGHFDHAAGAVHDIDLLNVEGSWIRSAFDGSNQMTITSWHHQAINIFSNPNGRLFLTAKSSDGIHEAYQSHDGQIILLQFHPELLYLVPELEPVGAQFWSKILATRDHLIQSRVQTKFAPSSANSCSSIF